MLFERTQKQKYNARKKFMKLSGVTSGHETLQKRIHVAFSKLGEPSAVKFISAKAKQEEQ